MLLLAIGAPVGLARGQDITASALREIHALAAEKASRTPSQRKISSQLLYARQLHHGRSVAAGVSRLLAGAQIDAAGTTLVDIAATVTDDVLSRIAAGGGVVVSSFPQFHAVRARVPIDQLEDLADSPEVRFIRPAERMALSKTNTSEGDVTHKADRERAKLGATGSGIIVGVLSDSAESLSQLQASGDLPPQCPGSPCSKALSGQAGSGTSEGTAMMEIVFDLAPGAKIKFATGDGGEANFAQNILNLRQQANARVIVDDITYFLEPVFQDGVIAQAVNSVVADGAVYVSSAGNDGNLKHGTSGTWEGDYVATSLPPSLVDSGEQSALDFGGGNNTDRLTQGSDFIALQWSDPFGGSSNDYDLYLLSSDGTTVLEASTDFQTGSQDPVEALDTAAVSITNDLLVVTLFSGQARFLHLGTFGGQLSIQTTGATFGHNAAKRAVSVAAVDVATAGCPSCGPFLGGASNPVEPFSSDGPRRIFFLPDGSAITPGNFSSSGGRLLQKVNVAAADGVSVATPGFDPFFGTSAAAPHAAAIAALVLSKNPGLAPSDVRGILAQGASDVEESGFDFESGAGVLNAKRAVELASP